MNNDNTLSLIDHCSTCTSSCCTNGIVITTEENHAAILASGAPDYFWHVSVPAGNFFINDFRGSRNACTYRDPSGRCTIETVKPTTCKTYPVMPDGQGETKLIPDCPAITALNGTEVFELYKTEARNLLVREMEKTSFDAFSEGFDAYYARDNKDSLHIQNAIVIPPPALQ